MVVLQVLINQCVVILSENRVFRGKVLIGDKFFAHEKGFVKIFV